MVVILETPVVYNIVISVVVIPIACVSSEVSKSLHKTEERLKDVKKTRDELETAIDSLRDDLSKTEQKKKDLQHKVRSPEVTRVRYLTEYDIFSIYYTFHNFYCFFIKIVLENMIQSCNVHFHILMSVLM